MPGPALARDLVAGRDVDDVDGEVRSSGLKVAARLSPPLSMKSSSSFGKRATMSCTAARLMEASSADGGVRAAAGLDAHDALRRQRAGAGQEFRVLARVDVVGDDGDVVRAAQAAAQPLGQRGLAGAHRAADADPERSVAHERNSLVYWVSWRMERRSSTGAAVPSGRGPRRAPRPSPASTTGKQRRRGDLPVRLAERHQPDARGTKAGREGAEPARQRRAQRHAVEAGRGAEGHGGREASRVPRGEGGEARVGPSGLRHGGEGRALLQRLQRRFGGAAPSGGERGRVVQRRVVPASAARHAAASSARPRARALRAARRRRSPPARRGRARAVFHRRLQPVAVAEAAHRISRREPRQQPVSAPGSMVVMVVAMRVRGLPVVLAVGAAFRSKGSDTRRTAAPRPRSISTMTWSSRMSSRSASIRVGRWRLPRCQAEARELRGVSAADLDQRLGRARTSTKPPPPTPARPRRAAPPLPGG
jgi:hypothetical protein